MRAGPSGRFPPWLEREDAWPPGPFQVQVSRVPRLGEFGEREESLTQGPNLLSLPLGAVSPPVSQFLFLTHLATSLLPARDCDRRSPEARG